MSMVVMVCIMTCVTIITVAVMMFVIAKLSIFFFTELVCLIPCCLDEYLKCWVQVYYEYEEYETHNSKYNTEYCLDNRKWSEECKDTWYDEWDNEKNNRHDNRPHIEKDHSEVELTRDANMTECHTCWESERHKCGLAFEYDEELGICKTHIQKESKDQIDSHDDTNWHRIAYSEETQKENIECDNREWTEYSGDIVYFEYWEEVPESIEESLYCSMWFFTIALAIAVYHLYNSTVGYWFKESIEYEYTY